MLKNLILNNFQSHKHSELVFNKGLNVIIGQSDSGKTAIIRALRWLVTNRPLGNAFCSSWGGETSVSIDVDNIEISRIETPEKSYTISTLKEPFKAFGTNVPEEITNALNLNEINIQSQLDQPFLLSQSPGEVALHFNKIAKLDKIDLGLQNTARWIKDISKEIDYKTTQLQTAETTLKTYSHLEKFEIDVENLEEQEKTLDKKQKQVWELQRLKEKIISVDEKIESKQGLLKLESLINSIFENIEKKKELETRKIKLKKLLNSIKETEDNIKESEKLISCALSVDSLLLLFKNRESISTNRDKLKKVLQNAKNINTEIETAKNRFEKLHAQFDESMGDVCLLCNQKIKK